MGANELYKQMEDALNKIVQDDKSFGGGQ
jgi:hypothetical protein